MGGITPTLTFATASYSKCTPIIWFLESRTGAPEVPVVVLAAYVICHDLAVLVLTAALETHGLPSKN
jgi:hypothetical protein